MFFRKPRTVKVAVTPIFGDQGFAQIFGSSVDIFELSPDEWERICSSPDAPLRPEVMCSLRELKSGTERLVGEEQVKLYFPRFIREHQKRISERELGEMRVDSLSPSRWPMEVYIAQGEAQQRVVLRELFRMQRCVGATIRQANIPWGVITLDDESPCLSALTNFLDYRRPTNVSMPVCLELRSEDGTSFCIEIDMSDFEQQKPGLLGRILAY
jgi:hypothetical protein